MPLPVGSYPAATDSTSAISDRVRLQLRQGADYAPAEWCRLRRSIVVEFSQPMQTVSVQQALSLTPSIEWRPLWNDTATHLTIEPLEDWHNLTTYQLQIDSGAESVEEHTPGTRLRSGVSQRER